MDTKLKNLSSIQILLEEMTVDEKLGLLSGGSIFKSAPLEKYGIPAALMMDGGTGFNTMQMGMLLSQTAGRKIYGDCPTGNWTKEKLELDASLVSYYFYHGSVDKLPQKEKEILELLDVYKEKYMPDYDHVGCYPPGILLGATWNPDVVYECGRQLGAESMFYGVDVLLGTPNVNLHRDPRGGRLFEGYSEDPFLIAGLAPEFVKGLQSTGVCANVKHYAANNQETWRMGVDEQIEERTLRELYLPGFKACVEAGCATVMTSYNKINGIPSSQNGFLIEQVLRNEWKFDGLVISDWGGVYDWKAAIKAGNDLRMPGPVDTGELRRALEDGQLTLEEVDQCVERILRALLQMPVMKCPTEKHKQHNVEEAMEAAYHAAEEGIILLKNDRNVLPLDKDKKVSYFGKHCQNMICCGEGSAEVLTNMNTSLLTSVQIKNGTQNVLCEMVDSETQAIVVVVSVTGKEGRDRESLQLPDDEQEVLKKGISAGKRWNIPVICVLNIAGPVEIMKYEKDLSAVLCTFLPGMGGGRALADILFGDVNPSGKLPITYPKYYRDCPTFMNFPGEYGKVVYGEGLYVGYRYYDKKQIEPLYPFGYGLSYTTFSIEKVDVPEIVNLEVQERLKVCISIRNTGNCYGKEVVQIYVEDIESHLDRPVKELKGFSKIALNPGEMGTAVIYLDKESFSFYDTKLGCWVLEPGKFILHIGTSSRNIAVKKEICVQAITPYALTMDSEIEELIHNQRIMEMLRTLLPEIDIDQQLKEVIIFDPHRKFSVFWNSVIVRLLCENSREEICNRYNKVAEGFIRIAREII